MIKLCIYENNRNSFKIGDRVRSKLPKELLLIQWPLVVLL